MKLACPTCDSNVPDDAPATTRPCPRCGRLLVSLDGDFSKSGGWDDLTADLKDAFGSGAFSLGLGHADRTRPMPGVSPAPVAAEPLRVGARLGDFEILGQIGRGGMGVVYRARQVSLNRTVALKVLAAFVDPESQAIARFRKEAQAAARLHHTNIVAIHAQGEHSGYYYYAMELIEGESLDAALRRGAFRARSSAADAPAGAADSRSFAFGRGGLDAYRRLARLLAEVADALAYAHQNHVIHRDIKPQNLLLGRDGRLHVTDFGLAHLLSEPHLTTTGQVMGTPLYMSPEQVRLGHGRVDWRTDIYSLGVTLYEVLTGEPPFTGETRDQIIDQVCTAEPRPPRRLDRGIPRDLETICLRAMEKNRLRRYASAGDMAEDLRRFADDRPIRSRRTSRLVKAGKWVRRHKWMTGTISSLFVVVVLTIGLTWVQRLRRLESADRRLNDAYESVAYINFREPPPSVEQDIAYAEARGADPTRVRLVRAMARATRPDRSTRAAALADLEEVLKVRPDSVEARCVKAVMLHLNNETEAYQKCIDGIGTPRTATEWFFYGYAIHFKDPQTAKESYRRAIDLHAAQNQIYPQAMIHLARAQNQLMYRTRQLSDFEEAADNLRQLTIIGVYGAYPHYLLSITYRLAAEIEGSSDDPDNAAVPLYYRDARAYAEKGQQKDKGDDRPVTAEAEYWESFGDFEKAIDARTRAIKVASESYNRDSVWEGHHYRWRLYYWQNRFEEALADLDRLSAEYDPRDLFYTHVYPIFVHAEMGDRDRAVTTALRLAEDGPGDARRVILASTCLRLLGEREKASALLDDRAAGIQFRSTDGSADGGTWWRVLYDLAQGRRTLDSVLSSEPCLSGDNAQTRRAEALFYAGAIALAEGRRAEAVDLFDRSYRCFDGERRYTFHAKTLCVKLKDPAWPPWLPAPSGNEASAAAQ